MVAFLRGGVIAFLLFYLVTCGGVGAWQRGYAVKQTHWYRNRVSFWGCVGWIGVKFDAFKAKLGGKVCTKEDFGMIFELVCRFPRLQRFNLWQQSPKK